MRYIAIITLIFSFLFPAHIFAQEIVNNQPIVMDLQKGQKAPFSGIFLNSTAAAQILAEKKYTLEECGIEIDYELSKQKAELDLMIQSINLSLESERQKNNSLLTIKDDEISRLQELAIENSSDYSEWWLAGGVVVGILVSVSVFAIAVEIKNN